MAPRVATIAFGVVLAAAIVLRVWFVLNLPFGQAVVGRLEGLNDEPAHFNYVRYLVEHRAFPVQTRHVAEPGAFERADFEYYQPPLYYLLCAPLVAVAGERAGLTLCRALSLLSALLSLLVLSRILALLGLGPAARQAGVAFAALLPVHVYFTSVVSNDGLSWLIALLITHELLRRAPGAAPSATDERRSAGMEADVRLGVLLGVGMLTKTALVIFYPVALLVYAQIERREPGRRVLAGALVAIGVSLLFAAPWYARNLMLYATPFALEVGFGPPEPGRWSLIAQANAAAGTIRSFWLPMRHLDATLPVVALRALGAILVAVHATVALGFLARRIPLDGPTFMAAALLAANIAGHVSLNLMWGESEGRFLLPALGPLVFLFVAPVFTWLSKRKDGERLAWIYLILVAAHPYLFLALA
jgi:4-amino-4-deoxy-L-arabinose transferase-like glycosyltransferase